MLKLLLPIILIMLFNISMSQWWATFLSLIMLTIIASISLNYTSQINITSTSLSDSMSSSLIILSILITAMMILASNKILFMNTSPKTFITMSLLLLSVLTMAFSTSSIIMFYIWFEASLIPTLLIILFWGYQPERMQAGMYLMMYTICASLPMFMMFMYLWNTSMTSMMLPNIMFLPTWMNSKFLWLMLIIGMLVKLPMFMTHLWLPKAHVEAPIAGSMILAAILLKLGGYGLMRILNLFQTQLFPTKLLFSLSMVGAFLTSLICLRQPDMKSLIAYSSVGHMGLLIAGALSMSNWGMTGSLMMMIAHGLCSSALFILANISYSITHTRSSFLTKGMLLFTPALSMLWFLMLSINMAAPPSFNLVSEILLMTSIMSVSSLSAITLALISFFTAAYSLNLFSLTQHGQPLSISNPIQSFKQSDMLLVMTHLIPLVLLTLKPEMLTI